MTRRHSKEHRFREDLPESSPISAPQPSDVFFRVQGVTVWCARLPSLDPSAMHVGEATKRALGSYEKWCALDVFEAIEWQLAEPDCPLAHNPIACLLEVYASAHYPFHVSPEEVVLFRLDGGLTR